MDNKINEEVKEVKEEKNNKPKFTLDDLLSSKRYRHKQDLLSALLVKDKTYTLEQVDKAIENYLSKEVK